MRRRLLAFLTTFVIATLCWSLSGTSPASAAVLQSDSPAAPNASLGAPYGPLIALHHRTEGEALWNHRHDTDRRGRHHHADRRRHHRRHHRPVEGLLPGGVFRLSPRHNPARRPLMVVIGASFSVGVGAGSSRLAWPEDMARLLRWRLIVSADPGAGYINRGTAHLGPFSRLLSRIDLARLHPRLVIIQGGHDDIGWPPAEERARVRALVRRIESEAPAAQIAVVSVFSAKRHPRPRAWAIDRAVVTGAEAADPSVLVFNPLRSEWRYPRLPGHLHPTRTGYRWLAHRIVHLLAKNGLFSHRRPVALSSVRIR